MAQIIIKNLRKDFGDFTAVKSSSFTVEDGEFFMLLGPSGCGKTTTLRMIAGLELPTSGEIYIDGEDVSQKRASNRDIAFVFQMFALYPHLNVRQNISYPLKSQGMSRAQIKVKVAEVAKLLGIEEILDKPVGGLSGGDRQRIALGRAIVREPIGVPVSRYVSTIILKTDRARPSKSERDNDDDMKLIWSFAIYSLANQA